MRGSFNKRLSCPLTLPFCRGEWQLTAGLAFSPDRDAVVGALMPAGMVALVECPSFSSSAPTSDVSAMASPMNGEECVLAVDIEDRLSPNPWQEKKGEVKINGKAMKRYLIRKEKVANLYLVKYVVLSLNSECFCAYCCDFWLELGNILFAKGALELPWWSSD